MGWISLVDLDVEFYVNSLKGKCVGFGGKLGSGKTYLADALVDYINNNSSVVAVRRSFGDGLRDTAELKVGIPIREMKHNFDKVPFDTIFECMVKLQAHCIEMGFKYDIDYISDRLSLCGSYNDVYRFVLQYVGTELYRIQKSPDYWCDLLGNSLDQDVITVIDDIRFPNELNIVKNNGVSLYSILMNSGPPDVCDSQVERHASETSVGADQFEVIYWNTLRSGKSLHDIGKCGFNLAATYWYLFKVMNGEPEKEKILQKTVKSS